MPSASHHPSRTLVSLSFLSFLLQKEQPRALCWDDIVMATCNREEAKSAVLKIAKRYGHLDEEMMRQMEQERPEWKYEIEEAFLAKERLAGGSIITFV